MSPQTGVPRPTRKDGPEHRGRNFVSYIFLENSAQEAQEALGRNRKQKLRCKQQDIAAPSLIRLLFFWAVRHKPESARNMGSGFFSIPKCLLGFGLAKLRFFQK